MMFRGFLKQLRCGPRVKKSARRSLGSYQGRRRLGLERLEDRRLLTVFLKEPYVQNVTPSSMTIMWETDSAASTLVEYRQPGESEWESIEGAAGVTIHEQDLSDLSADATYEYRVTSDTLVSLPRTFHTAPARPRSYRFVASSVVGTIHYSRPDPKYQIRFEGGVP